MIDPATLHEVEDLLAHERAAEAAAKLEALGDLAADRSVAATQARYLRIRVARARGGPLDRALVDMRALLAAPISPEVRSKVLAALARGFAAKGCAGLAKRALAELEALAVGPSLIAHTLGQVAIAQGRRTEALAHFERALEGDEPFRGHAGLASALFRTGHFDEALEHSRQAESHPRARVLALRGQAMIARVRGHWSEQLRLLEALLANTPGGSAQRSDRLQRAYSLWASDRRDDAREELRALWCENENDRTGKSARALLDNLDRAPRAHARAFLASPAVQPSRDPFRGPPVLELMLRSLAHSPSPDVAAGTAMTELTRYLERLGLETIRFEGTPERLRACLDAGLPVLVEEEYSTMMIHRSLVVGIDEELGLLYIQDPTSHLTRDEPVAEQERRGSFFRHSALVAFPRVEAGAKARLAAAGVTDSEHLRLIDAAKDPALHTHPKKQLELLERAIALCEDSPVAWSERLRASWHAEPGRDAMFAAIARARVRYPHRKFTHQMHASWLLKERRVEEALLATQAAERLDPWDANDVQREGHCHQYLGRRDEAAACYWRALALFPSLVRTNETFAGLAADMGDLALAEHLSACALDLAPQNVVNHWNHTRSAQVRPGHELEDWAEMARRARAGLAIAPNHGMLFFTLAKALGHLPKDEERDAALDLLVPLVKRWPKAVEAFINRPRLGKKLAQRFGVGGAQPPPAA
jgi:tetratricopeptide (TPR) repeat protein